MIKKLCNSGLNFITQRITFFKFYFQHLSYKAIQNSSILNRHQFPHYKLTDIEQRGLVAYFTVCFLTAMSGSAYKYIGCSFRDFLLNRPIFTQFVLHELQASKKEIKFSTLEEMGLEDHNIREVHKAFELDEGILYDRTVWNLEGLGYAKLGSPEANEKRKVVINPNFASVQTMWGILNSNNSNVILGQQKVGKTFGIFTYCYLSSFLGKQRRNSIKSRVIIDQIVDEKKYNLMRQFIAVPLDRESIVQDYKQLVKRQKEFDFLDKQVIQSSQEQEQQNTSIYNRETRTNLIVDCAQTYYDMYVKFPSLYSLYNRPSQKDIALLPENQKTRIQRLKRQYTGFLQQLQSSSSRNAFCASRDVNEGKIQQKQRQEFQYGYESYYRRNFADPDKFDWFGSSGVDQSMDYFSFSHQLDGHIEAYNILFFQLSLRFVKKGVSKQKLKQLQQKFMKIFKLPYQPNFGIAQLYKRTQNSQINIKQIRLQQNWRIKVRQNVMNEYFNKHMQTALSTIIGNIDKNHEQLAISFKLLKHKIQFYAFLRMKRYYIDLVDQKGYSTIQKNASNILKKLQQSCKKSFSSQNNQYEEYSLERQLKIQQFAYRLNEDQKYYHSEQGRYKQLSSEDNSEYFFTQNLYKHIKFSQNMSNLIRVTNFTNVQSGVNYNKQINLFDLNRIYNRFWVNLFQQGHFIFKINLISKNIIEQQCSLSVHHTLDYIPMQKTYSIHNHFATIFQLARQNEGETVGGYIIPSVEIKSFRNVDLRNYGFDGIIVKKIKDLPQFQIVSLRWDGVNAVFEDIYYQQQADLQGSMVDILSKIAMKETINWNHVVVVPKEDVTIKGVKSGEYVRYIFDKVLGVSEKYVNGHKLSIQLGEIDYQSEVPFFTSSSQTKIKDKYTNLYYQSVKQILEKIRKGKIIVKKEELKKKRIELLEKKREEFQVKNGEALETIKQAQASSRIEDKEEEQINQSQSLSQEEQQQQQQQELQEQNKSQSLTQKESQKQSKQSRSQSQSSEQESNSSQKSQSQSKSSEEQEEQSEESSSQSESSEEQQDSSEQSQSHSDQSQSSEKQSDQSQSQEQSSQQQSQTKN